MAAPPRNTARQLGPLLRGAWSRQLRRLGRGAGGAALIGLLFVALMVAIGTAIVPETVARGSEADPGGTVLEMAFWLVCLASAVVSFRVMEALYRTGDVHLLAPLPIRPWPLFAYRISGLLAEATFGVVCGAAMFLPVLWRGDPGLYIACLYVIAAGFLITVAVGLGVQLYAGVANLEGDGGFGTGGPIAFTMAPGIALGVAVALILFQKLVAEEFLREGFNRGAQVGISIALGASVVSLLYAWQAFRKSFYPALARFFEADNFVLDVGYEYFKEGPLVAEGWEKWLSPELLPLVRKDQLQYRRRFTLGRLLVWGVAIGLAVLLIARGADALPRAFVIALPLLIIAIFANPWGRLHGTDLERGLAATLPVEPALILKAKRLVAAREVAELAIPLVLAVTLGLALGGESWLYAGLGGGATALLMTSATPLLSSVAIRTPAWAGAGAGLIAIVAAGLASLTAFNVIPLAMVLAGAGLVWRPNTAKGTP